jgi:hypothetical protein
VIAIEILSPDESAKELSEKIVEYSISAWKQSGSWTRLNATAPSIHEKAALGVWRTGFFVTDLSRSIFASWAD